MAQTKRFPHPIPYGWYYVGYCDELAVGEVRPLRYFGRDLVLFRNESGQTGLLDAHCPHLGAHIGYGGHVKGELIHCPFHGWGYDAQGWCRDISYAKNLPAICKRQAVIHAYPVREANGVIWAWYHPHNIEPLFDVMVFDEFTGPEWAPQIRYEWRSAINVQEEAENAVDTAHFQFIHGAPAVPEGRGVYEGHIRRTRAESMRDVEMPDGSTQNVQVATWTIANGAGQKITGLQRITTTYLMVLVTPIDEENSELRFAFTYPWCEPGSPEDLAYKERCAWTSGERGVLADLPIWDHKIHQARPILCDGDGPILPYRKWFEQFYVYDDEPHRVAAE
jgi:phenylpropionate dioxygenase-like ring-hydroxylating dioxygenase large terminal subunit